MARGELMTLLRWAQSFPEEVLQRYPRLALYASQVFMQVGQNQRSIKLLASAGQALKNASPGDEQAKYDRGVLTACQSLRAMSTGHPRTALELSERATKLIGPEDRLMSIQIARTNGFIHYNLGNMTAAVDALYSAMELSRQMGQHYWLLESAHWLILSYIKMGDLQTAITICGNLEASYAPDFGPLACVLAPHGIILTEWNQLADAESLFRRSIEMSRRERLMDVLWISCIGLARVHLFSGELEDVTTSLLDEGFRAAEAIGNEVVLSIARTVNARVALARDDLDQARAWADSYFAQRPTEYPAELEDLTLARVWIALGKTEQALTLLDGILGPIRESGRNARLIEAQIMRAVILDGLGRSGDADTALGEALSLGEPQGYLRTFIDHIALIGRVLQQESTRYPMYVRRILSAAKSQTSYADLTVVDALTEREVQVLRLLARGASNQEIAQSLVIGVGTVKSHMNHIMSKLDVRNRTEAVAVARSDGLID